MAGEWLTATANTNMFTYEIAPVFILMETVVMEKMREIIGFHGGDSILAPGQLHSWQNIFLVLRIVHVKEQDFILNSSDINYFYTNKNVEYLFLYATLSLLFETF